MQELKNKELIGSTKDFSLYSTGYEYIENQNIIKTKKYFLYMGAFSTYVDGLDNIIYELNQSPINSCIEIHIHSPGGDPDIGLRLVNVIKDNFKHITCISDYQASSMGSLIFCIGDKRIIHKYSRHMMHNYSTGYRGKASDIKTRVKFFDKHLISFLKDVYVKKGFLSKREFNKLRHGKEFWFNARKMLKRGIATHIRISGKDYTKKQYIKQKKAS